MGTEPKAILSKGISSEVAIWSERKKLLRDEVLQATMANERL